MAKFTYSSPIFDITPSERAEKLARADQNMPMDPDIEEMVDADLQFVIGGRNSLTGALGGQLGMWMASGEGEENNPLNLTKKRSEVSPVTDPLSWTMENNPEGIAKRLENVPYEEYPYLLSSSSWNEFERRVMFVKSALPEAQKYGSSLGAFAGYGSDIAGMIGLSIVAEPVALAGLGVRGPLAAQAASASLGMNRVVAPAIAASEAAATISRTNLAARWLALGAAEEAVYQGARNGVDPVYDPSASSVIGQIAFSGGISSILGGAVFGRAFVRSHIEDAAAEFRRLRTTNLPGGYTITWGDRWHFDAPAAADQMLFAPGALSLSDEARRVGRDLFFDWRRRADLGVADMNIPGTRTLPIGEVPIVGAPRPVRSLAEEVVEEAQRPLKPTVGTRARETMGIRSIIKAAAFELSLAGVELTEDVFTMLARVAVNTYNKRVSFGAFNKAFWEEVSTQIPPEAVARLRPVNERAFIGGIDRTVMDAATREDMVSAIWDHFRAGSHLDSRNEASLIFQVLQQIRDRGGMVNRQIIADVVDELRKISQNPPKRVNARGKTVLDPNARRLAVINLVNKHTGRLKRTATQATPINIPTFLLNRLGMGAARGIPPSGTIAPLTSEGPSPRGGPRDFSDYPQLRQFGTERIPIWSTVGNQSARAMESNNGAARMIAWHVFNARRALDHAQPMTIMENGLMLMHKTMYMFNRAYRNGFVKYAMGGGTTNVTDLPTVVDYMRHAFGRREVARQFHQRVAKQLRTGAMDDAVSGVNEAARGMRELLNNVHSLAASVNLRGFTQQAVANYMPRMWRFDRIRRLATTEAGRQDLVDLVRTALDYNGGRRIVIDGVEQTVSGDLDAAAKAFADRLISIATKTENAPLIDQEQALADALMELAAPIRGRTPSRTPYGRARTLLNEEASIRVRGDHFSDGSGSMSIADLTNDDLPFVFRKYVTSVLGAVNEKRLLDAFNAELRARNIQTPAITLEGGEVIQAGVEVESVEAMMKVARKLGGEIGEGQEEGLKEVIAAMRFEPFQRSSATIGDRILGIALPYGYLTTGGQFGLAALGEMGRIVGTLGVRRMLIQMPILTEMLSNWKNLDRPAQNFASFMDAWFSPSTDRLRRALFDPLGGGLQYGAEEGGMVYRGARRVLDGTANAMSDITGLAPITSFTQQLTAATTLQHLYDVARGGAKRLDPATIRTLGLEPEQYEQIIQFVGRNAEIKDGFLGARVVGMANIDHREMDLIRNFVYRMHTSRIQSIPTRGDFHKHVFSFVGRLLTQFRTFNLKGIDNFLIQNAGRVKRGGAARVSQEIAWTMVFAGSLQYARNYADYRTYKSLNNKKKMEELEPLLGPEGFVKGAMTGPSEWFLFGNTIDAVKTRVWGGDPIFSPYRYTGLSWWGFPGEAMARRAGSVTEDIYGATVGKSLGLPAERDITQSTVHNMRLLAPGQNIPGLKQFFSITEDEIVTEYNLQRQQPRKPRD